MYHLPLIFKIVGSLPSSLSVIQRFQLDSNPPSSVLTLYGVAPRVVSNVPNSRNIAWVHAIIVVVSINLILVYRR